jgi:curved DNA-binding protein CbpA
VRKFEANADYYGMLGVPPSATDDEIDKGFKTRAREQHPDAGGTEEQMKLLNEAREVLSDPQTRAAYDEQRNGSNTNIPYGSSAAFGPETAASEGLKIKVADGDFVGLLMGAVACIGLGIPFLVLIHMQYVFFLWPLHYLTLGVLGIGVLMGHAALSAINRRPAIRRSRTRVFLHEAAFWIFVALIGLIVYLLLYA